MGNTPSQSEQKTITIRKLALSALALKRGPALRKAQLAFSDYTTGTIHKSAGLETNGSRVCARSIQPAREAIQFSTCQNRSPTELLRLRGLGGPDTSLPRSSRKVGEMQGPIRNQNSRPQIFLDGDTGARTIAAAQVASTDAWLEAWLARFLQVLGELGKRSSA